MLRPGILPPLSSSVRELAPTLTRAQELSRASLPAFIQSFHVSPRALRGDQVLYFVAARSLLCQIERMCLPVSKDSGSGDIDVNIVVHDSVEHSVDKNIASNPQRHPSTKFTIGQAGVRDLASILPHQRCYAPEQLLYLLANGKLTKRVHLREDPDPGIQQRALERPEDDVGHGASSAGSTQRAYVLLDVSQSMNGELGPDERHPDQRCAVGRGIALAALLMAQERGALLHFRPFSSDVGDRVSAKEPQQIAQVVREILTIENAGTTALQKALEGSVQDLEAIDRGTRVDVMLITDGVSHLSNNPFEGRYLHTFLLGNSCKKLEQGGTGVFEKLSTWSTSFSNIRTTYFEHHLRPRESDLRDFANIVRDAHERLLQAGTTQEVEDLEGLVQGAGALLKAARRYGAEANDGYTELSQSVQQASKELTSPELRQRVAEAEKEYQRLCQLYEANLPGDHRPRDAVGGTKSDRMPDRDISLKGGGAGTSDTASLLAIAMALYGTVSRFVRRFTGKAPS